VRDGNLELQTESANIIETVLLLHSMTYDAATIARRLHLDQASVLHVIECGTLPQRQLSLAWEATLQSRMHTEAIVESGR
jgi:hypothetical protein